jgi:hypothetical protein
MYNIIWHYIFSKFFSASRLQYCNSTLNIPVSLSPPCDENMVLHKSVTVSYNKPLQTGKSSLHNYPPLTISMNYCMWHYFLWNGDCRPYLKIISFWTEITIFFLNKSYCHGWLKDWTKVPPLPRSCQAYIQSHNSSSRLCWLKPDQGYTGVYSRPIGGLWNSSPLVSEGFISLRLRFSLTNSS